MRGLLSVTLAATLVGSFAAVAQAASNSQTNIDTTDSTGQSSENKSADAVVGGEAKISAKQQATTNDAANSLAQQSSAKIAQRWLKDGKSGCSASALGQPEADSATWSGRCDQGFADGSGTLTLAAKGQFLESLTDEFDKGVPRDGRVDMKWADGSHYSGDMVSLHMDGSGLLTTTAGDRFEGHWVNGRMNGQGTAHWANGDQYTGDWKDGKASGHGVQIWSDGHKYAGDWQNDLPNGHGIVTRKDGSSYEADFVDGHATHPAELATTAADSGMVHSATAVIAADPGPGSGSGDSTAGVTVDSVKDTAPPGTTVARPTPMSEVAGKKLIAVDGSTLTLTSIEDGLTREIVSPSGTVKKSVFAFLNDKLGSVSEGADNDNIVGVFRLTKKGILTDYSDGRSELFFPNKDGGVSMRSNAASGEAHCIAWYPEGHHFSLEERQAAVAEYANRLGIQEPAPKGQKRAPKPSCDLIANFDLATDSDTATLHSATERKPQPAPHETAHTGKKLSSTRAPSAVAASFILPAPHDQPLEVRPSTIHTIDADAAAISPSDVKTAANEPALGPKPASASECLTIESDGQHWDFRNHCGYDVQFAYCLMNSADALAACSKGAISGSVGPNGSTALVADRSLSETNADHDFRWVACGGGAGEVVVHLDQSDPPSGRCVRPGAS